MKTDKVPMSNKSIIGKAVVTITLISLFSRLLGFLREILFANYYGTANEYEIYLVASIIPLTINTVSIFFFQNYFIPNYSKIKNDYPEQTDNFVKRTFYNSLGFSVVLCAIFIIFPNEIMSIYAGREVIDSQLNTIFIIFSITIIPAILSSYISSYLNSANKFSAPAFSLLFINLTTIIALFYFKSNNIIAIALGYLAGSFIQLIYLISKVKLSLFLFLSERRRQVKFITFSSVLFIVLIEFIGQLYVIVDRYFYSSIDQGGIASLNYATNIFLLPISVFTVSLTTAIMPKISDLSAKEKLLEMNLMLNKLFSISFFFFIPFISVYFLFGENLVRIIFERGAFDSRSTEITHQVLFYLSLSMIFYVIYSVLNKYLYSLRKTGYLLLLTIFVLMIKIFLNHLLVSDYKQNGLAFATSLSYFIFFAFAFIKVKSEIKFKLDRLILKSFIFYILNICVSFLLTVILISMIKSEGIMYDILLITVFFTFYFINNMIFDEENQKLIWEQINVFKK
jgi:putative peptidoglycan lipid II flippase